MPVRIMETPSPVPPPEPIPQPTLTESGPKPPEKTAFQRKMTELLSESEPMLRDELTDQQATQGELLLTAGQVLKEWIKEPHKFKKHSEYILKMDTALRGRDKGSLKQRFERQALYTAIAGVAAGADLLDRPVKAMAEGMLERRNGLTFQEIRSQAWQQSATPDLKSKAANMSNWKRGFDWLGEQLSNTVINEGVNWTLGKAAGEKEVHFGSPLAEKIAFVGNFIPKVGEIVNTPAVEAVLRFINNVPIYGALSEKLYIWANRKLSQEKGANIVANFVTGFTAHVMGHSNA